jgi:predicted acylesterase/phospholipase RssA
MTTTDSERAKDLPPCDLVMKGGITSGVVYPGAAVELAKRYRFKNIGGTSVGAISAAVIAAAEYGRQTGHSNAWSEVDQIAQQLKVKGFVRSVFQPSKETQPVFELLMKLSERKPSKKTKEGEATEKTWLQKKVSLLGKIIGVTGFLAWHQWLIALFTAIPLGALIVLNTVSFEHLPLVPALVLLAASVVLALGLVALFAGWAAYRTVRAVIKALERNGFGFCTGLRQSEQSGDALIEWLHDKIQTCAGLGSSGRPLTFRMLQQKPHEISLSMVTTNLSYAQPERLPFREGTYLFWPHKMMDRFPEEIVRRMIRPDGGPIPEEEWTRTQAVPGLDLPIVVGARLSMSFPLLFSAMPLHSNHPYTEELVDDWFSDGGITSNFPIHFFDSWFPEHPTFGLDLQSVSDKGAERPADTFGNKSDVNLPSSGPDGRQSPHWTGTEGILGFGKQIKDAVQNWRDTAQAQLPGSRDRVCQIRLYKGQGGLNLDMDPEVIDLLDARGRQAAAQFQNFSFADHQWVRYLTLMELLQTNLHEINDRFAPFKRALDHGLPGVDIYIPGHEVTWCQAAAKVTEALLETAERWSTDSPPNGGFAQGKDHEPTPTPVMRATPPA